MVYWKCIIWAKSDLPIINSVCEKAWFTTTGRRKCNFLIFAFSSFRFQTTIVKNLIEKPLFFIMDFQGSYEVLLLHNYFWSTYFKISNEMHFVSLFFLNELNIKTSLLMIHWKCTVVHYAYLNSRSINQPYLRAVEYAILFFSISYLCFF